MAPGERGPSWWPVVSRPTFPIAAEWTISLGIVEGVPL